MSTVKTAKGTELPLLNLKGKNYLTVPYRVVWFREERPKWSIETEFVSVTQNSAMAKAIISDEAGRIVATAHKTETMAGFPDFVEKSETGAIGRALALCGYGTAFTDDLEEGTRLADSPLAPRAANTLKITGKEMDAQLGPRTPTTVYQKAMPKVTGGKV